MDKKDRNMFEIAKSYFPGASDEEINYLLWEKTCFPMSNIKAEMQLRKMRDFWSRMLGVEDGVADYFKKTFCDENCGLEGHGKGYCLACKD